MSATNMELAGVASSSRDEASKHSNAGMRTSIDQNIRPTSANAGAPFVGVFQFEKDQPHDSADRSNGENSESSSVKEDIEKESETDNQSNAREDLEKQASKDAVNDEEEEKDPNVIEWDGPDDPGNPLNWPWRKRVICTVVLGLMTFVVTFASSIFSTATDVTSKEYGVSTEVMTLGTSLFILGFAFGPIVWSPMSELYGRKYPLFIGYFIFAIFQIPVAVAQNLQTIFICRFFGGFFASAPLGIIGGLLADIWDPIDRGVAISVFAAATFVGPAVSPIIGGFVVPSYLGWRWTEYLTAILAFFWGFLGLLLVPETYAPVLLSARAKKIRHDTKNWAVRAKSDEQTIDFKVIAEKYLLRPFTMLFLEPILILVTIYMSLIYGILYLFFEVFPIAFQEERQWNSGVGALPFISLLIGVVMGSCMVSYITKTRFARKLEQNGEVVPEERLVPMMIGSFLLPIGLFWFAWTSNPGINCWPQIISCLPIGAGILSIFMQGLNYLIDVYKWHANSAIAANTFVRSWAGAGFPLFAVAMYDTLGVPWATSLLAFLCVMLLPAPVLFYIYGEKVRKMSRYSPT